MRKSFDIREKSAGALLVAMLAFWAFGSGCDALDPVETLSLCGGANGVISQRCGQCEAKPYAKQCPQCQGRHKDPDCADVARVPDEHDAQVLDAATDAAMNTIDAHDGSTSSAADGGDAAMAPEVDAGWCEAMCNEKDQVCDARNGVCRDCLVNGDCKNDQVCSKGYVCVACNVDADCKLSAPHCTAQHACVACVAGDKSCDGRTDATVCDTQQDSATEGQCVQCTGTDFTVCKKAPDSTPYVCDSAKRKCTKLKAHSVSDCAACVSDAQCGIDQVCTDQFFGLPKERVGSFCFWKKSVAPSGDCANLRPYKDAVLDAVSLDGQAVALCMPGATTCLGLSDTNHGCESLTKPGTGDDALCGFQHSMIDHDAHENQDAYCIDVDASAAKNFRCTTPCNNTISDCPGPSCNTAYTPDLCGL